MTHIQRRKQRPEFSNFTELPALVVSLTKSNRRYSLLGTIAKEHRAKRHGRISKFSCQKKSTRVVSLYTTLWKDYSWLIEFFRDVFNLAVLRKQIVSSTLIRPFILLTETTFARNLQVANRFVCVAWFLFGYSLGRASLLIAESRARVALYMNFHGNRYRFEDLEWTWILNGRNLMGQSDVLLIGRDFRGTYYETKPMGGTRGKISV